MLSGDDGRNYRRYGVEADPIKSYKGGALTVVAIMQPTYLPWMGYFAMMDRVDVFVFLDSVQFARRSWQQRNRIKSQNGAQMLTVPVVKKGLREQFICDARIDRSRRFEEKHHRAIERAYAKAPFFLNYSGGLMDNLHENADYLGDYNIGIINWLREQFNIDCKLERSSNLGVRGKKAELLCRICQEVDGDHYLSALGSKAYLDEAVEFTDAGITVDYNPFNHPIYPQLHGPFEPFLSAIDLLFHMGEQSIEVIRRGYTLTPG